MHGFLNLWCVQAIFFLYRELLEEVSKVAHAGNFFDFYITFNSQQCYSKFSGSLIEYLAILQSVELFIVKEKYNTFKVLVEVLTGASFLSEVDKREIKSEKGNEEKTKEIARKKAFIDILNKKPVEKFSQFMICIRMLKPLCSLHSNVSSIKKELYKNASCYKKTIHNPTPSIHISRNPALILDSSCLPSPKNSPRSSWYQISPPNHMSESPDPDCIQRFFHLQSKQPEESCIEDYCTYLKERYKNLPNTSLQDWHDQLVCSFIDITIEKIGRVQSYTNSCSGAFYSRQYSTKTLASIAEMFQIDDNNKRQVVLIEGNAGSGKTTLFYKICKEWVEGKILRQYTLVVLVCLREQKERYVDIQSLKYLFGNTGINEAKIFEELNDTGHKGKVLFLLDGWDEMHDSFKKRSVFTKLLSGELLPHPSFTVVVTTRPSATINLNRHCIFSSKYRLKGFCEPQIKLFVEDYLEKHAMLHDEIRFMQVLKGTHGLEQLAEVPLNLSILLKLFCHQRSEFPSTLTEIYSYILLAVVQCHKKMSDSYTTFKDLSDLPENMLKILHGLEKAAFELFSQKEPISEERIFGYIDTLQIEQMQNFNGMGLLEIKKVVYGVKEFKYYLYRFKVLQEFLAAQYLTRLKPADETKELQEIFGKADYEMIWVFYAGISKFTRVPLNNVFPELERQFHNHSGTIGLIDTHEKLTDTWQKCYAEFESMRECKENHMEFLLTLIQCCYEAKNSDACKVVADYYYSNDICHIEIPSNHANPSFLLAISYFINHSGKIWSLRCDSYIQSGIDILQKSLPQSLTGKLWVLCFVVKSSEIENFIELTKMQPSLQWIRLLNGSDLGVTGIEKLCNFLTSNDCKIIRVDLEHSGIREKGLKSITNLLKVNSNILCINLKSLFSIESIITLLLTIKQNTSLQYLILEEHFSKDYEMNNILQEINDIRKGKNEKLLTLIQDHPDQ